MTLRSAVERAMVVLAESQGSGIMLAPRLVLTSAHVLRNKEWIRTVHPNSEQPFPSKMVWRDDELDVALLLAGEELVDPKQWALGRLRWGAVAGSAPVPGCEVVGFPAMQRFGFGGHLEYDQLTGTVLPMAGRVRSTLVCEFDRAPAAAPRRGESPFAGLSGAPLFAGAVLIGVVTQVPVGRDHRRIEATPIERILNAPGFPQHVLGVDLQRHLPSMLEPVESEFHLEDERFERHYGHAFRVRYRKIEIFGIDELGTTEANWDLDTAYLSLEAITTSASGENATGTKPVFTARRINELLAERPRTLIRGEAGAGKTTLVWWIASHAASSALEHDLAELNGLVPFIIPMRSLLAQAMPFPGLSELATVAELQIDRVPDGWTRRVLEAGRALLLVDGIDEVPPPDRENARRRLADLLAMYPHNRCLVTVRPLAVAPNWLRSEGFEELQLLPMRDEDVLAFSKAWHSAARLEVNNLRDAHRAASEDAALQALESALESELARNPTLLSLSRTPLLAAVVCALHRRRRGFLPETRWSLYNAALTMLLGSRDTLRRVNAPEGIVLGVEEHQQLLQRIAAWLARSGYAEFNHTQAKHQIELAMRSMRQVRKQGSPEAVLTHLLNRSGLLQERNDTVIQFIHRTFQDYLAAKELQESDGLGELLAHAADEEWQDIIILAVGHCNRGEVRRLIEGLIEKGDKAQDRRTGGDIHVLAARCALSAVVLDEEVQEQVAARVRALIPPDDATVEAKLTSLGSYVFPLIPAPDALDEQATKSVVQVIRDIGGSASLPLLQRFALHASPEVCDILVTTWPRHPAEEFAQQVLAYASLKNAKVTVITPAMVAALRHCGAIKHLIIDMSITCSDLARFLPDEGIRELTILDNPLLDELTFVRGLSGLTSLSLKACPKAKRLSSLEGLSLTSLHLELNGMQKSELASLKMLDRLVDLSVSGTLLDSDIPLPSGHRTVETLKLISPTKMMINDLSQWPSLRKLIVHGDCYAHSLLLAASRAPSLNNLEFSIPSLKFPQKVYPPLLDEEDVLLPRKPRELELSTIRTLTLKGVSRNGSTMDLARVFPSITQLTLECSENTRLDFTPLRHHVGLVVKMNGRVIPPKAFLPS